MKKNQILKGIPAYPGKVLGKVKIISRKKDIEDLKQDQIVVCQMTNVVHIPFLKKASAIVTDEGGITCHAAIISRELKIPCIISTRIATKVLKNGDLVEVDANKGIVKMINK